MVILGYLGLSWACLGLLGLAWACLGGLLMGLVGGGAGLLEGLAKVAVVRESHKLFLSLTGEFA
jgi:hypothetical protein